MGNTRQKLKSIVFNADRVRNTLNGTKRQFIRVINPQPSIDPGFSAPVVEIDSTPSGLGKCVRPLGASHCPYGLPGDELFVKECYVNATGKILYRADYGEVEDDNLSYSAHPDAGYLDEYEKSYEVGILPHEWKPAKSMSHDISRIKIKITSVKYQRLHDITHEDAVKEGISAETACDIFRMAAGSIETKDSRWIDGGENYGDYCVDCIDTVLSKIKTSFPDAHIDGSNVCDDSDGPPFCDECHCPICVNLTGYGLDHQLFLDDDDGQLYWPASGGDAAVLVDIASNIGCLSDRHTNRLMQIAFATKWNEVNHKRKNRWEWNPWVWIIGFEVVDENEVK